MISATDPPGDAHARPGALDVPTHPAAARAAENGTTIEEVTAAHGRRTVVRRVREAISPTVLVEEVKRGPLRTRTI